jgi:aldehyde:ferredoxin oxidoreductase
MSNIIGGYWGRILWIDLTTGKSFIKPFNDGYARKYLGGAGMAAQIVSQNVTKHTNPLSPQNVMVIATGPFQSTRIPGSGRVSICAKSPLTGYWGESSGGGNLGPQIKRAGYDVVVVKGRAAQPVYIEIIDQQVNILSAQELWGKDTVDTTDYFRDKYQDKRLATLSIGQGGENLVRYASIVNEKHGFFGRCGIGAVMGSKNLKGFVIKGSQKPPVADPDSIKTLISKLSAKIKVNPFTEINRTHGQAIGVAPREQNQLLPMKNWQQDSWSSAEKISAPYMTEELEIKPWACPYCVMGCHRKITSSKYGLCETGGPEYETLGMIGSNLLIDDIGAIAKANELMNRYGIDTIDTGGILAWAFDCYEKGLITQDDTDGIELTWGNGDALIAMTEKIANRDGFGNLLAEGMNACSASIKESKSLALEVMGMAMPAHDPRAFFSQTISSIASTRGACHLRGYGPSNDRGYTVPELGIKETVSPRFENDKKGYLGAIFQDVNQITNCIVMCYFYIYDEITVAYQTDLLKSITGWDISSQELGRIGERNTCLQHLLNLKWGLDPVLENVLPKRLRTAHVEGEAAGQVPDWVQIRQEYWQTKGWNDKGIPRESTRKKLGLDFFD